LAAALVLLASFVTRFYKLWDPSEVVFDEVHFGKFASYYIRRTFFFDVHPPLAKMLIAAQGYLVGLNGDYLFDKIGESYIEHDIPYISLRSFLIAFDNGMVVQSRLILLDTFMMIFLLGAVFFYIRFYKARFQAFGVAWWTNLCLAGVFLGLVTSVKLVGLLTVGMIGIAVIMDLWRLLDVDRGLTMQQWSHHFAARALALIAIPIIIYMSTFYVHFAVLNRSGPGDRYMSPAFQGSLYNSPLHASSHEVRYHHNITLKHKSMDAYLHSHPHNYPLRYTSGRVSSQGRQVTGYSHKDVNNFWTVLPVGNDTEALANNKNIVRNGDTIRLLHTGTDSYLFAHDVASPLTATNMELTTAPRNDSDSKYEDTLWRLEIDRSSVNETHWTTSTSYIRLISVRHGVAIYCNPKKLPDWGFGQFEINGNKKTTQEANVWVAEEIEGVHGGNNTALVPKEPLPISFFRKFFELNKVMIERNAALTKPHPYQSNAISWPFVLRGVSYWTKNDEHKQIYFMGHPTGWWLAFIALLGLGALLTAQVLAQRRGVEPISPLVARHLERSGGFLLLGYLVHFVPFMVMGRALFLHHYLPALMFAYMGIGILFQYIFVE
ncbi:MIR motif-containing protein, partial [Syncephalis pseudoplumigaleata]